MGVILVFTFRVISSCPQVLPALPATHPPISRPTANRCTNRKDTSPPSSSDCFQPSVHGHYQWVPQGSPQQLLWGCVEVIEKTMVSSIDGNFRRAGPSPGAARVRNCQFGSQIEMPEPSLSRFTPWHPAAHIP